MWYIVLKEKTDPGSMRRFGALVTAWIKQHEEHKAAKAYEQNLMGIFKDLKKPSKFTQFIEVVSNTGQVAVVAKVSITGGGIDLSEVVKHSSASSESLKALFAWAAARTWPKGKVTLTAAYVLLIDIYRKYGFEDDTKRDWSKMPKTTQINAPMTMTEKDQTIYVKEYLEDVFWEMLPDLIGG